MRRKYDDGDIMTPEAATAERKRIKDEAIANVNKAQNLRKTRLRETCWFNWRANYVEWFREQSWINVDEDV